MPHPFSRMLREGGDFDFRENFDILQNPTTVMDYAGKQPDDVYLFLPHLLPQPLLLLVRPVSAIQPDKHRRIRNRQRAFQHQHVKCLARVVQLGDDLPVRQ
jgi:hypothetical protein